MKKEIKSTCCCEHTHTKHNEALCDCEHEIISNENKTSHKHEHEHEHGHEHKHEHEHGHEHEDKHEHEHGHGHEHKHEHEHGHEHSCGCEDEESYNSCSCGCGCGHAEHADDKVKKSDVIILIFCLVAWITMLLLSKYHLFSPTINTTIYLVIFLISGRDVLSYALKSIIKGKPFDENFLMSLAAICGFLIGEEKEALAVMIFYNLGEIIQGYAVKKSRNEITELMNLKADKAMVIRDNIEIELDVDKIDIGEIIVVRPGDRIPIDGQVVYGSASLDTAALTGESIPLNVNVGDNVLSGSLNTSSVLHIKTSVLAQNSTISKILNITEQAVKNKAKSEKFITRFAKYYTPVVVGLAVLIFTIPSLIFGISTYKIWLNRAMTFLVASCPCALIISIPLTFFAAIGGASRFGVLIKGASYIDTLAKISELKVIFDKTGTLTYGKFAIKQINFSKNEEEYLDWLYSVEKMSKHPVAVAICDNLHNRKAVNVDSFIEIAGKGIKAKIKGKEIIVGCKALLLENNIAIETDKHYETVISMAVDKEYVGEIVMSDRLRDNVIDEIKKIRKLGVKGIEILTGDNNEAAKSVAYALSIDEYKADMLPIDKLNHVKNEKARTVFVGDGINDAPVLVAADVGIAISSGLDAAIEAADIVLMNDNIGGIAKLLWHSKRTIKIIKENIFLVIAVKIIVLILAALGLASMWAAIFADVGMALLAILNATRIFDTSKYCDAHVNDVII